MNQPMLVLHKIEMLVVIFTLLASISNAQGPSVTHLKSDYPKLFKHWDKCDIEYKCSTEDKRKIDLLLIDATSSDGLSLKTRQLLASLAFGDLKTADTVFPLINKAELNLKNKNGDNVFLLHANIRDDDWLTRKVSWVLNKEINTDVQFYDGEFMRKQKFQTFIEYIALSPVSLAQYLKKFPEKVNQKNPDTNQTALGVASRFGNLESIQILLMHNADIDVECENNETPLIQAILSKEYTAALFLVSVGANTKIKFVFQEQEYESIRSFLLYSPYSRSDQDFIDSLECDKLPVLDEMKKNLYSKKKLEELLLKLE